MFNYKIPIKHIYVSLFYLFCAFNTLISANGTKNLTNPMEYFVLSEDFPLKSNFEFVPSNNRLILIAKLITYELTDQQKKGLTKSFL